MSKSAPPQKKGIAWYTPELEAVARPEYGCCCCYATEMWRTRGMLHKHISQKNLRLSGDVTSLFLFRALCYTLQKSLQGIPIMECYLFNFWPLFSLLNYKCNSWTFWRKLWINKKLTWVVIVSFRKCSNYNCFEPSLWNHVEMIPL